MPARVRVAGADFDLMTHAELISSVVAAIGRNQGGTIVTPNIDICQRISKDDVSRALLASASFVVPDGMPLLWAARLARSPLIERITGADLIYSLSAAAAVNGWSVYVIGGRPASDGTSSAAERAGDRLSSLYSGLQVAGSHVPPTGFDAASDDIDVLVKELTDADPRVVLVGLGFPKQERLIARLAPQLPNAWFVGCGAAIAFAAGELRRAPRWVQRLGCEWVFRLAMEPRRLAGRYLRRDLPFAVRLLARSAVLRTATAWCAPSSWRP